MEFKIEHIFKAEEFLNFVIEAGWTSENKMSLKGMELAIFSSTKLYCIRDRNLKLIAISRVISDNYIFSTIPELIISKEFRNQGLGSMIVEEIIKDFGHTIIYFGAQKGNETFFEKFNFMQGPQSYTKHFSGFRII